MLSIRFLQNVDAAIKYINVRPTPLALYVFSGKRSEFEYGKSWTSGGDHIVEQMLIVAFGFSR